MKCNIKYIFISVKYITIIQHLKDNKKVRLCNKTHLKRNFTISRCAINGFLNSCYKTFADIENSNNIKVLTFSLYLSYFSVYKVIIVKMIKKL